MLDSAFCASDLEGYSWLKTNETGLLGRVYFAPRLDVLCSESLRSISVVTPV